MLIDAHTHFEDKDINLGISEYIKQVEIFSLVCASDNEKFEKLLDLAEFNPYILPTLGLHPWKVENNKVENLFPHLEEVRIIGEIGLDSIWCQASLKLQEEAFVRQLEIAKMRNCPIILHTKGEEKRVLEIIKDYSMPKLVHWYSCNDFLKDFIDQDCYFTIGPDIFENSNAIKVAKEVPINRLMVETDGLGALEWAFSKKVAFSDIPKALKNSIECISKIKNISPLEIEQAMEENLNRFAKINLEDIHNVH